MILLLNLDLLAVRLVVAKYSRKIDIKGVSSVTASIGITCLLENDTVEQVLQIVDAAMYQAKNNGRNQIHIESRD